MNDENPQSTAAATPGTAAAPDLDAMAGTHNARAAVDPGLATIQVPVTGR